MELCLGFCIRGVLLVISLSGYFALEVSSGNITNLKAQKLLPSSRTITGQVSILRQCRRQFTFLASAGLGHFITRIMKESPLTPLRMPPLDDPPRWNFLTLPLQFSAPYAKWMKGYLGRRPRPFYKDLHPFSPPMNLLGDPSHFNGDGSWRRTARYRRNSLGSISFKPSPLFVAKAVKRVMKHLHSMLLHSKGSMKWLMRMCQFTAG